MQNALVVIYLVIFAAICSAGKLAEIFFLVLFSVVGLFVGFRYRLYKDVLFPQIALMACAFTAYVISPYFANTYYLTSEMKVMTLFEIYLAFRWLSDRHPYFFNKELFSKFLVLHIYLLALLAGIQTVRGIPRDTVLFGFSINAAYSVVFAYAYLHNRLGALSSIISIIAVGVCGSTMATLLILAAVVYKYKTYWKLAFTLSVAAVPAFLYYSLVFRGKDFIGGDIYDFDRVQLFLYFSKIMSENFDFSNYLFGWGIGREIPAADPENFDVISGWFLQQFVVDGIYSYSTHNEYIRLILDFGIIGTLIVIRFLKVHLPNRVFAFLAVAFLTNTTIFATSNIVILSAILGMFSSEVATRQSLLLTKSRQSKMAWKSRRRNKFRSGHVIGLDDELRPSFSRN